MPTGAATTTGDNPSGAEAQSAPVSRWQALRSARASGDLAPDLEAGVAEPITPRRQDRAGTEEPSADMPMTRP